MPKNNVCEIKLAVDPIRETGAYEKIRKLFDKIVVNSTEFSHRTEPKLQDARFEAAVILSHALLTICNDNRLNSADVDNEAAARVAHYQEYIL
jgi:hypothetical protein